MKRMARIFLIGLLVWVIAGAGAHAGEDLATKIEAIISGPDYKQAHWGLLVVDSQTGQTIYAHNPDHLFFPASTTKLYSCSAALAALGSDYRFETSVYRRGKLKDSHLDGDLVLVWPAAISPWAAEPCRTAPWRSRTTIILTPTATTRPS
jgi:D-alanyl-D-alanine carboxypeptidase